MCVQKPRSNRFEGQSLIAMMDIACVLVSFGCCCGVLRLLLEIFMDKEEEEVVVVEFDEGKNELFF